MKKQLLTLTAAFMMFSAQHAMHAHSWWTTVTNWFSEKPAVIISAAALTVVAIGLVMYNKSNKTRMFKADKATQTEPNQAHPVEEVKRPEYVSSNPIIEKAAGILKGVEAIDTLICEDVSGKKEAYFVGLEIKKQAEQMMKASANTNVQKAIQTINTTTEADYVRGTNKHYHFYQAVETLVYAVRAHRASLD